MSKSVFVLRASFVRPADTTAYAANDLVANSTTAAQVTPLSFNAGGATEAVVVRRAIIRKSGTSLTNASFRLHLLSSLPTLSVGDNGAFDNSNILAIDDGRFLCGTFDVTIGKSGATGSAGQGVSTTGSDVTICSPLANVQAGADMFYGLLTATAAYTPSSQEQFQVLLECLR